MTLNIPNMLTLFRIAMIPLFVGVFYLPQQMLDTYWVNFYATFIFTLAAITDWLDGYLARKLNQTSAFGAFLDPVADKLMVVAALVVLVELGRVGAVVALIIIGREITISALREWMAGVGASGSVAVATIGKVKTAAQMIAIPFLLYFHPLHLMGVTLVVAKIGTLLIYIAAILTLVSMAYYLQAARKQFRS